jgi:hypothetical protein
MAKPVIFMVSAVWDAEADVWSGRCDGLAAAADAPTLPTVLDQIDPKTFPEETDFGPPQGREVW